MNASESGGVGSEIGSATMSIMLSDGGGAEEQELGVVEVGCGCGRNPKAEDATCGSALVNSPHVR